MNLREMQERLNAVAAEMSTLHQKGDERSAEEESRFDQVIAEFNELAPKVEEAQKREADRKAAVERAGHYRQSTGRVSGIVPKDERGKPQDDEQRDTRSIGQRFAELDRIQQFRTSGGPTPVGASLEVGSLYTRHQVQYHDGDAPVDRRALVYTGGLPADYIQPQFIPGFFRGDDLQGTIRDALINGTTTSDAIVFFRETAFTNSAAAVAQATATDGSSGLKPESAITFEQDDAPVVTIAHWIPITRQTLQDASQLQTYVEQRLIDGLRLEESDQLLNGSGTGANMTGLLNTSGVQDLDDAVYFAGAPVNDAGSPNENFNRILRARTLVRTVGRARASFVTLNPADLEVFYTATNANQNYYGSGPFSGAAIPNLWGLRVIEDENLAAGTALVGDGRMAAVWDRMQAQILIDTIDDQFVRNMLTILAEERIALTVFRPQAFAVVELAAAA